MKKRFNRIVCLLVLVFLGLGTHASAQHYVGVRGGMGGGTARFDPKREMGYVFGYPSAGVTWKYYSPTRIVGAVEVDVQYVQKGYKMFTYGLTDTTTYQRTIEAIEVPFFWQPHFYVFNRHGRVFVNLGVYASYFLSQHEKQESNHGGVAFDREYEMLSTRDNKLEFGLCGGVGIGVFLGRFELLAEARYSFGYSDLMKARAKYPENPLYINRSPVDMINVSVGLNYRLGKGGILAPASSRK